MRQWLISAALMCLVLGCKDTGGGSGSAGGDLSSPKAAVKSFAQAMSKGDVAGVRAAVVGNAQNMALVETMAKTVAARQKMVDAAAAAFGEQGKGMMGNVPNPAEMGEKVDKAQIKEEGDTATVTFDTQRIKVRRDGSQWKLDAASIFGADLPTKEKLAGMEAMVKAMEQTADEIKAGKYKTYQEAMQAWSVKLVPDQPKMPEIPDLR